MNVLLLLFGATGMVGMVGQGVLRECLLDPAVQMIDKDKIDYGCRITRGLDT